VASVLLALGVLGWALPRAVGTTFAAVGHVLVSVGPPTLAALAVLWMAGIYVHSFVLTAALPGLGRGQALTLNLTGSAVANVLPFGGATAMALNHHMVRTWGMSGTAFASYTLVTNLWVVLLKLVMPLVALVALLLGGVDPSHRTTLEAWAAAACFAALLGGFVLIMASRATALAVSARAGRALAWASGWRAHPWDGGRVAEGLVGCRDAVASIVTNRVGQMSAGMLGYAAFQALLLGACLGAVGLQVAIPAVLAGYAADRILTLIPVTPGGLGFAELGAVATLVALGVPAAPAAAGILLYRAFTFAAEIPVGGLWLAGWFLTRRPRAVPQVTTGARP
jgi:uncharacterized protein (TIRG00374 family)